MLKFLKYKFISDLERPLAVLIKKYLKWLTLEKKFNIFESNPLLVPVPLHPRRLNWRGFNQSEVLGKIIAKDMGWEYCPDLLVRRIATLPQVGLDSQKRKINLKGAFEINKNYSLMPSLPAQAGAYCLVLFDDVWTTGSTIKEAAQVLRKSGCKNIWGMTLAR